MIAVHRLPGDSIKIPFPAALAGTPAFGPKQTLVSGCYFPTDNLETRVIESIEHRDSKFLFRFWQKPKRPQTACDFRPDG